MDKLFFVFFGYPLSSKIPRPTAPRETLKVLFKDPNSVPQAWGLVGTLRFGAFRL